jgi:hypothetical protein
VSRSRSLAPLLALVPLSLAPFAPRAAAQDVAPVTSAPVTLAYQFDRLAGKVAIYTIETETRVNQENRGQGGGEVCTWVRQTLEQRFEAPRDARPGVGRVVLTPRRIEARLEQEAGTISYDSKEGGQAAGPFAALAAKIDKPVTLDVTRTGDVRNVKGVPSAERVGYRQTFLEVPERPLDVGDSWDRLDRQPMEPYCTIAYHWRYRLAGTEPGEPARHRLEATIRASLEDVFASTHGSVELKDQHGEGSMVLDADGLLRESTLDSRLEVVIKTPQGLHVQKLRTRTRQVLVELR